MTWTILILAAGGAVLLAGGLRLWRRRQQRDAASASRDRTSASPLLAPSQFLVALGDVVTVAGQELWLTEGWLLREAGEPVAALLFSREAALLALPLPRSKLYLLQRQPVQLSGEPPTALDLGDWHFERIRRLPVEVEALGRNLEPPCRFATLGEYRGLDRQVLWLLVSEACARAWRGRCVEDCELECWGSADQQ